MLIEQRLKESEYEKEILTKEIERIKSIQVERDRISRDLHDDIGSGLSAMKLQAEYLESLPQEEWSKDNLHELVNESQDLTTSMREIVWSLNTQYDNLRDFVQYIRRYAVQYFDKSVIKLVIDVPTEINETAINGLVRRNVFLVFKELLHNILKHSQATEVNINISIAGENLSIKVRDNGVGFDTNVATGNGTHSMQYRMKTIGGQYELTSTNEGTQCSFSISLDFKS